MRFKRLLALLLAAALALGLLAGCGGESVASALLKLLDGRYPNISVEMDPDLEAELRRAISEAEAQNAGDDAAVIRAALETALGSDITFRYLGDGQKGETAFDLVFYAGSDPDKAAQAAYSQWNLVFSNVPGDGQYDTSLAMVETNSGVWMLVKATVEKAGTVDKADSEPDEPETQEPKDPYTDNGNNSYTVNTEDGLQKLYDDLKDTGGSFASAKITLNSSVTLDANWKGENITFTGELNGNGNTITMEGNRKQGLFDVVGEINKNVGTVKDLTIQVDGSINVSDENFAAVGVVAGTNYGSISNCTVTVNGSITATTITTSNDLAFSDAYAGGIAGRNEGTIESSCSVELNDGTIQATATGTEDERTHAHAGGIAGRSISGTIEDGCGPATGTGAIQATVTVTGNSNTVALTLNGDNFVSVEPESANKVGNTYFVGTAYAGTKVGS